MREGYNNSREVTIREMYYLDFRFRIERGEVYDKEM